MAGKLHPKSLWLIVLVMSLIACNESPKSGSNSQPTKVIYQPEYATFFKVIEAREQRFLVLINPLNNGDNDSLRIDTAGFNLAALSATHSAFLAEIDAAYRIKAVDNCSFHGHEIMQQRCQDNLVYSFGETNYINPEVLLRHKITCVSISGFDSKPQWSANAKRAGISTLRIWEWKEKHPLGKAEWIVAFGYLVGHEQEALSLFRSEVADYQKLAETSKEDGPTVFAGNPYQGVWYCPKIDSYLSKLFDDAGWNYDVNYTGVGSASLSNEEAILQLQKCDVWIYHGSCKDMKCIFGLEPRLENIGKVQTQIWAPIKLLMQDGRNPFWDYGAIYPSRLLKDFIEIGRNREENTTYYQTLK